MEMRGFPKSSPSALSTSSIAPASPPSGLKFEFSKIVQGIASLRELPVSLSSRSPPRSSTSGMSSLHIQLAPKQPPPDTITPSFGSKARSCIYPCSFISQQSKRISSKVNAANLFGRSSAGRAICVSDDRSGRRFLVNTGERLNVIPPAHAVWTPQHLSDLPKFTSDKLKTREIHQLAYISQFALDIRHIDRSHNEMADVMSRPSIAQLQLSPGIDLAEIAVEKRHVRSPCDKDASGFQLQNLPLTTGNGTTLCDVSTTSPVPLCLHPFASRSSPPCTTYRTVGVELPTSCFSNVASGLGCKKTSKHGHGYVSVVSGISSHRRLPHSGCTVQSCPPGHRRSPSFVH
nr:unnamed protein product [Spirometra erinaceieuropaei]